MKNNKGFTLIEVLGVLVILSIIVIIVFPIVNNSLKNSQETALRSTINGIEKAAYLYGLENNLSKEDYYQILELYELKNTGFLKNSEIINPVNNEELDGCVLYKWNNDKHFYKYAERYQCEEIKDKTIIGKTDDLVYKN